MRHSAGLSVVVLMCALLAGCGKGACDGGGQAANACPERPSDDRIRATLMQVIAQEYPDSPPLSARIIGISTNCKTATITYDGTIRNLNPGFGMSPIGGIQESTAVMTAMDDGSWFIASGRRQYRVP